MELREVLRALRAGWWLPVVALVVGVCAALGVSLAQRPSYTASAQLFVSTANNMTNADLSQGSQFSEQRVTSYAQLLTGRDLASRVVDRLRLPMSATQLSHEISASVVTNTVLIEVEVTDASPVRARDIANAVSDEFTTYAAALEATDSSGASPVKITVTERATLPMAPSSPQKIRNTILGGLIGLILGAIIAVVRVRFDRSVKDASDASALAGAPLIGTILRDVALEKQHTIDRSASSRTAEDYRQLRTNLQFLNVDRPPKVIMVSSAVPSEGKTTLVINLGLALAEAGQRVTVVEADLRRPKITRYLGMVSGVGLTNVLAGTADIDDITQTHRENFFVIAAGPNPPNPGELLASSHMGAFVEKLRSSNDFVIIDAPPLLPVADASGLAAHTDGVLLSTRYGSTRKDQLRQANVTLERVGSKVLGVVLNIVPPKAELATAYGYSYSYEAERSKDGKEDRRSRSDD